MEISLNQIGKRFGYEWIFKNVNLELSANNIYGLKGPNGSGKSTLMQVFSGHLSPSEGKIKYSNKNAEISRADIYKYISFSGPYIDIINQFTLREVLSFHFKFKESLLGSEKEMIQAMQLEKAKDKQLAFYSSGMRQRVKLALSLFSNTPILLMDEPSTNLDQKGINWYQEMLEKFSKNRLVMVASNEARDYQQAKSIFNIEDYKKQEN